MIRVSPSHALKDIALMHRSLRLSVIQFDSSDPARASKQALPISQPVRWFRRIRPPVRDRLPASLWRYHEPKA